MDNKITEREKRAARIMAPFAFLLPVAVLIVVCLIGGVSPFGNATLMCKLNSDVVLNIERFRRAVTEGESLFYSFTNGLGNDTWSTYASGYFSPVYLLALLFSPAKAADSFLLITLVRMGLAGLTAYLLSTALNNRTELCLGFSVAYGGCAGFLICVFSPACAGAFVLLPAVGAGVIKLLKNGRTPLLAFSLLLFAMSAWQLLPAAMFFTAAIFVWGTNAVSEKSSIKTAAVRCAVIVAIALCASAVFAIPTMLDGTTAVRSLSETVSVSFPQLLSGMFMGNRASFGGNAFIYCSVCTLVMLPVYLLNAKLPKGERVMAAGILLVLLLAQILTPLGVIFTGFTSAALCESGVSFMFCACAVAFAARGLSVPSGITVGRAVGSWVMSIAIYALALVFGDHKSSFLVMIVTAGFITLYAAIVLVVMSDRRPPAIFGVVIMLCILAEGITAGADCIITAKNNSLPVRSEQALKTAAAEETVDDLLSGWEITGGREGISRLRGYSDVISSENLLSQYSADSDTSTPLLKHLGINGKNGWTGVTDAVFAVRYLIDDENDSTYPALSVGEGIGLYENKNALSVGFAASDISLGVDPSLSSNPFTAQELLLSAALGEQRTVFAAAQINEMRYDGATCNDFNESKLFTRYENNAVLSYTLTALCDGELYMWISSSMPDDAKISVNGKEIKNSDLSAIVSLGRYNALQGAMVEIELRDVNTTVNDVYFMTLDSEAMASVLSIMAANQLTFVRRENGGIRAVADVQNGEVILLTVPYSKGFNAVVDGKKAEIYKCLNGLMAIEAGAGQHTLSVTYTPAGFNICMLVSAMAMLAMLCAVIIIERRNRGDMPPETIPYIPAVSVKGMEPIDEVNVIPVAMPTLDVDLDFDSEENTLDWL